MKIGTITIAEPREVTQYYECAAWYRKMICDPGTFDVNLHLSPECWPQWILFGQPATVTGSCFDSLFCGNIIRAKRDEDVGQRADYTTQLYAYLIQTQKIGTINLLPEWEWLRLDSKEWAPHTRRLRIVRAFKSNRFDVKRVELSDDPNAFTVVVSTDLGEEPICLKCDEWNLYHQDCSGDYLLGDIREWYYRDDLYKLRTGEHKRQN